jgi:cation diffusion facilitator family transporter
MVEDRRDWRVIPRNEDTEYCVLELVSPKTASFLPSLKVNSLASSLTSLGGTWRTRAAQFREISSKGRPSNRTRKFYRRQKGVIQSFVDAETLSRFPEDEERTEQSPFRSVKLLEKDRRRIMIATTLSLIVNILLFFSKMVAAILSGSLSVVSSLVDSALDLFSGVTLWFVNRAMRPKPDDIYKYPSGKSRLEPVAIIVCASVMGTATLQLVSTSIQSIVQGNSDPQIKAVSGSLMAVTVISKFCLFSYCRRVDSATVRALALDHRNDVASNLAAIVFGLLGTYIWPNADPLGAILIAVYIIINWCMAGYEQSKLLIGKSASPDFLKKLTFIAMNHHREVSHVDTVRAFHFGQNFLVEVHVVLDPDMSLRQVHDIEESLQQKLEKLDEVERAFVHVDFEIEHDPLSEHKQV